jgi:catechol 2,3-dioxygenase-like lactoylglutathione lyase family enzyme
MIKGLRSVALGVTHLGNAAAFFEKVWNLTPIATDAHAAWFRGTGPYHHILALHEAPHACILRIVFDVGSKDEIDRLHAAVVEAEAGKVEAPGQVVAPGGGYGFGCHDPEGRCLAFVTGSADHTDLGAIPDRVGKISHANLNAAAIDRTFDFFTRTLAFRKTDQSRFRFLRCNNPDHHSIVLAPASDATLNHIAFEMPDLDSVMRGAGRMRDNGYPIEWGVGRHGPGNNVFAYFAGPEEVPLEYTAEVLQVDDSYVQRGPDDWRYPPGRSDLWGVTSPRSARLDRIQELFRFDPEGYRVTG